MTEIETTLAPTDRRNAGVLRETLLSRPAWMWYILIVLIVLCSLMVRRFASPLTVGFLLLDVIPILIMGLPMTMVMITGDIDLSVASVLGLSSALVGVLTQAGLPFWLVLVIAMVVGIVCGAFNGVMTAYVGLPALAVTIGTMALYRGLALVVIGDRAVANFPPAATAFVTSKLGATGIPVVMVGVLLLIILFGLWLHMTPFGRGVFALGNSKEAARFVGVDVARSRLVLFIASGFVASLAGIFWTLRYASARSDNGMGLELSVIAAVVLGGVSVFGGKGTIPGSVAGILIIGVVNFALRLNRVPEVVLVTLTGLLLIISVVTPSLVADARDRWHRSKHSNPQTAVVS